MNILKAEFKALLKQVRAIQESQGMAADDEENDHPKSA